MTEIEQNRLAVLASSINAGHEQVQRKGWEAVEHAIQVGQDLIEARSQVEPGSWSWWFARNIKVEWTTAYRYMRLAEHAAQIRRAKPETIRDGLRLLAGEPRRGQGPRRYGPEEIAHVRELVPKIGIKNTAKQLGMSRSTVHKYSEQPRTNQARRRRLTPDLAQMDAWAEEFEPSIRNIQKAISNCARLGGYQHWLRLAAYALAKARSLQPRER